MNNEFDTKTLVEIASLLIHAAKIDEIYTQNEEEIIKKFINSFIKNDLKTEVILKDAHTNEENSNQILKFTQILKENSLEFKTKVVKELWRIVISDKNADEHESTLIRRICGLIYFPDKMSNEIKNNLIDKNK